VKPRARFAAERSPRVAAAHDASHTPPDGDRKPDGREFSDENPHPGRSLATGRAAIPRRNLRDPLINTPTRRADERARRDTAGLPIRAIC